MLKSSAHKPVIALDAGGVLVNYDFSKVFFELSEKFGIELDPKDTPDLSAIFLPLEKGDIPWDAVPQKLNQTLGLSLDTHQWQALCCSIFLGEVPGMRETLAELKSDFTLIALSNTIQVHWEWVLREYPIFSLLDGWMVSYEEGAVKPDAALYNTFSHRYCDGQPPFYFTDDTPRNVEAAQKLDWDAQAFYDAATLKKDIEKRRNAL